MRGKQNKWCYVPGCRNTSIKTPNKIFITVPKDYKRRKQWFDAARRAMPRTKTNFYCCEDHFNLQEDVENYMRYKMMGGSIFVKLGVAPHKFACQPDRREPTPTTPPPSHVFEQRAGVYKHEIFGDLVSFLDFSSTSTARGEENAEETVAPISQTSDCQ